MTPAQATHSKQSKTAVQGARAKANGTKKPQKAPASAAAVQVVQMAVKEGVSVADLAKLAKGDPAFAMRVLAMVNSAAFARPQSIADVSQAVSLLGIRGVRNVALGLVVSDLAPMTDEGALLLTLSLRRALASRSIAKAMGQRDPDAAFTAGLLLESGLLLHAGDNLAQAAEIARLPSDYRVIEELALDAVPHPMSGGQLAESYKLPEPTVEAILRHHDEDPPESPLAQACWLAERVAGVFEDGLVARGHELALDAAKTLGVGEAVIEEILAELPAQVGESAKGFQREVGPQPDLEQLRADANARLVEMNHQLEDVVRTLKRVVAEKQELMKQLEASNQALAHQAATDTLTQLPNRRSLEAALERDLARAEREQLPLSLVVADVDHFKSFNDTYGHQTGDEVLKVVGQVLRDTARKGDLPARFGGEEFCVILPKTDSEGALQAAERLRRALEEARVSSAKGQLNFTASFGVATISPGQPLDQAALFARADAALYEAKEAGRNCARAAK